MTRTLRVYSATIANVRPLATTGVHVQRTAVVAAPSKRAAAIALGQLTPAGNPSPSFMADWMTEHGNDSVRAMCLAEPGQVWVGPLDWPRERWTRAAVDPAMPWRLIAEEPV
jgi:hypothetical protein